MRVLVLNGPNLNLLGTREPGVYGSRTLEEIMARVAARGRELGIEVETHQSNDEGDLITRLQQCRGEFDGCIFNPAGYTHTSIALRDAILACGVPCVEVHLSNPYGREAFRRRSFTVGACVGQVCGFGGAGYILALEGLREVVG